MSNWPNWEDILRVNTEHLQKREQNRFPYHYITRYMHINQEVKEGAINNISEGGACMLIPEQLDAGQVISIEIPISRVKTSVRTLAEVMWSMSIPFFSQGSFIGLRFLI